MYLSKSMKVIPLKRNKKKLLVILSNKAFMNTLSIYFVFDVDKEIHILYSIGSCQIKLVFFHRRILPSGSGNKEDVMPPIPENPPQQDG